MLFSVLRSGHVYYVSEDMLFSVLGGHVYYVSEEDMLFIV